MSKPILSVDFDGVIHLYTSGWKGPRTIPDEPVPGALAFLLEAANDFDVQIYSTRSHAHGGIKAMQDYMFDRMGAPVGFVCSQIGWPLEKPPAFVTIDDRAICFDGTWPSMETLRAFKPWNKR